MTCNEETPLLYEGDRSMKTTVFHMILSFLALVLCVMLIVLPIVIASMLLMTSQQSKDVELSSSIFMRKLRNKLALESLEKEVSVVQYEFVLPEVSVKNDNPAEVEHETIRRAAQNINDAHPKLQSVQKFPDVMASTERSEEVNHLDDNGDIFMIALLKATYSEDTNNLET